MNIVNENAGNGGMNMEKKTHDDNGKTESVADRLPELTEEEIENATRQQPVAWAWNLIGHYNPGDIHIAADGGAVLQIISIDTIRCVRVYDHPEFLWFLSMTRCTCQRAGINLELGPYTIVTPLPEMTEEAQTPSHEITAPETKTEKHRDPEDGSTVRGNADNFGVEVV